MPDYITTREYADLHGIPLEKVRSWTKFKRIPFIKVGNSIMIERSTPIPTKMKKRTNAEIAAAKSKAESRKLKITITRAYYVAVEDRTGKELVSDFTFLTKAEAQKIGERMKKEVEGNNGNR